ncbi:MAG: phosphatidate cytidylyltransferase [Tissierellaceae bacterium]
MKEIYKRILSGIIGLLLLVFILNKGGNYLYISVFLISLIGLREFYKAMETKKTIPSYYLGYIGSLGIYIFYLFFNNYLLPFVVILILLTLISMVFNKSVSIEGIAVTLLGIIYIPFMLLHIVFLDKTIFLYLVFIIAFATDTFAYIVGNLFGKNKLCPSISPKKTIEGSIGGIIGTLIIVFIFSIYFEITPIWKMIILSVFTSIIAQLGDLVASRIKRISGIKDYGFIMPGHGGVLDRFDSIIFSAPVVYYFISIFIN